MLLYSLVFVLTSIFTFFIYSKIRYFSYRKKINKYTNITYKNQEFNKIRILKKNVLQDSDSFKNLRKYLKKSTIDLKLSHFFTKLNIIGLTIFLLSYLSLDNIYYSILITISSLFMASVILFNRNVKVRREKFISDFPYAIDCIVRAVQTGLPLADGFALLARDGKDPIKTEFQRMIEARQYGLTLPETINGLVERMDCPETRFFAAVVQIQSQSGGSISESLSNLSNLIRGRKRMSDKIKSMSAEAKASAYIIGSLPLFIVCAIYFTSPDYIKILFNTTGGLLTIIVSAIWMLIGCVIMNKMINFEI